MEDSCHLVKAGLSSLARCRLIQSNFRSILPSLFVVSFLLVVRVSGEERDGQSPTFHERANCVATDALGRTLPDVRQTGPTRPDRYVGIFYFLTHAPRGTSIPSNITDILAQDPDALTKPDSPVWAGPSAYYWAEPLYGYYDSTDPWVLRRHANLLADAGIDTVIFDTTNRVTYRDVYFKLCEVWTKVRSEGGRTPQICFMVNTRAGEAAQEIFNDLYKPGLYKELWFQWNGKPLMICDPKEASREVNEFFTLRKAHWPFSLVNTHNEWHWESTYPQVYSYDTDPDKAEQVNVAVAQNLRANDGRVTNMSEGNARGRSFHNGTKDTSPGAVDRGLNFQEQWKRALDLNPPFVMVTGWNEWTAGKFSRPGRPIVFVDQFDQEYSRDVEPVTGLHKDNYYYQLVGNVRRYKGMSPVPEASPPQTIDVSGGFDQWQQVRPDFNDHLFDNDQRDFGSGVVHYVNKSGRNDLMTMKVARDAANLYFYVKTREPIAGSGGGNWMLLLIDADSDAKTGWEGYDFIINRNVTAAETSIEKNDRGWKWQATGKTRLKIERNELMLAVPRTTLGLENRENFALDFKWWDNLQKPGDIMDSYLSGDVAPEGRFNYHYVAGAGNPLAVEQAQPLPTR